MQKQGMTLRQPATRWQDALPTGNGTVGALVYGNIRNEQIVLNHEALWFRTSPPELPSVAEHLPALRELLTEGKFGEADGFLTEKLKAAGYPEHIDPFHPAFAIGLDTETTAPFFNYRRTVDFTSGEVEVRWQQSNGDFSRKVFVSRADDMVVMQLIADHGGTINADLRLMPHDLQRATGMGSGLDVEAQQIPLEFEASAEEGWLSITGQYADGNQFGGVARVTTTGGTLTVNGAALNVRGATEVFVTVALFANEPAASALSRLRERLETLSGNYQVLLERHKVAHEELFGRVRVQLGAPTAAASNDEMLLAAYDGEVPTPLIQTMCEYGRYLLISSSRPGGLPANLQGVWNGDYAPAWSSDFHNDENIQMNYWAALPGNLADTTLPYFDYYEASLDDYRKNAAAIYGCRGILTPVAQSTHGRMYPGPWLHWTAGAGWLAQLFYDYWLFTGDDEFLRDRAVPFLKEVALFYEDFTTVNAQGKLEFSPSLSPENVPTMPDAKLTTINATMDIAIAREVLDNLCAACDRLGVEGEKVPVWRALSAKLPDYEVNDDGAIREWIHPDLPDNYHHRHISHIYPLFPGFEVTQESDSALFAAMRVAVEKRLVIGLASQTGWSLAHMANIYARLGDGDRALECLELVTRACTGPNLFTYHNDWRSQGITMYWGPNSRPPFQIDANFGLTAAVLEMLLFSAPGMVKLLPALPAKWHQGEARGLLCRGSITADIVWNMTAGTIRTTLRSRTDQAVTIKVPGQINELRSNLPPAEVEASPYGMAYRIVRLPAGKSVEIEVSLLRSTV